MSHYTERKLHTVTKKTGNKTITVTQEYSEKFDSGHYKYVIFDEDGNIVAASYSIAGAPKGKVTVEDASDILKKFESDSRFDREHEAQA